MHFLITIIIPCYNIGALLLETIDSVRKVADPLKHEVLIINDGSTDSETLKVLDRLRTSYTVIDQPNQGASAARNTGITAAAGKYLLFLDADNLLTDVYLTEGITILEQQQDVDVVYGVSETFGYGKPSFLPTNPFNLQILMLYNYIDTCCLVRKSAFEDTGMFDTKMRTGLEDWEMWLRMAFYSKKFYYLEGKVIQKYRMRPDSLNHSINKTKEDAILDYLVEKYPDKLDYTAVSNYYYQKFETAPIGWTMKLLIRKYSPVLYRYLLRKGKIRKQL